MSAVSLVSILSAADLPGAISHMMPFSGAIWELHILAANAYRKGDWKRLRPSWCWPMPLSASGFGAPAEEPAPTEQKKGREKRPGSLGRK